MIVFSFPVHGLTPNRRLKEYFVDQKFLGFSAVNKRFIKDYAMCNENPLWILGRQNILSDVELEWTQTLGMRKLSYVEDVENRFWIAPTWESLSWFFQNWIFSAWFLKDFSRISDLLQNGRKNVCRAPSIRASRIRYTRNFFKIWVWRTISMFRRISW